MNSILRAHLALASVALIYGANYVIAKSVMPDPVAPNAFIALRVGGAAILFWIAGFGKIFVPDRSDWWRFILCALTGVAVNQLLFFNGLSLTSPLNGAIIMTSNPIMVMLIAAWLLRSPLSGRKTAGVLMGAAGAISILLLSSYEKSRGNSALGDAFILVNSMSYAFYLVLVKPLMIKYHPLNVITWIFTIGVVLVLPFGGTGVYAVEWSVLTNWQWFAIFFVVVFVTFLTYLFNIIALAVVTPTTASAYIYFQPVLAGVFTVIIGAFLEREIPHGFSPVKILLTLLIFAGIYLVSSSDRSKAEV